ncbi:MAG TPA: hypothetical protein VEZ50_18080 [Nodosilinea sp.]|nr:hypothetical protein [Nodosilinea sp.]
MHLNSWVDGDDFHWNFHSPANITKMQRRKPLTDWDLRNVHHQTQDGGIFFPNSGL